MRKESEKELLEWFKYANDGDKVVVEDGYVHIYNSLGCEINGFPLDDVVCHNLTKIWYVVTPKGFYTYKDEDDETEKIAYWIDKDEAQRFAFEQSPINPYFIVDGDVTESDLAKYVRMD